MFLASYIGLGPTAFKKTPFTPEPLPHQINVKVDFYNHTQGIIGEKTYTYMTITYPYDKGNLNPVGKDLWAYVFVKDSKT